MWSYIVFCVSSSSPQFYIKAQNIPQYTHHLHLTWTKKKKKAYFRCENLLVLMSNIIKNGNMTWNFPSIKMLPHHFSSFAWTFTDSSVLVLDRHCCDIKNHIVLGLAVDLGREPGSRIWLFTLKCTWSELSVKYIYPFCIHIEVIWTLTRSLTLNTTIPCILWKQKYQNVIHKRKIRNLYKKQFLSRSLPETQ